MFSSRLHSALRHPPDNLDPALQFQPSKRLRGLHHEHVLSIIDCHEWLRTTIDKLLVGRNIWGSISLGVIHETPCRTNLLSWWTKHQTDPIETGIASENPLKALRQLQEAVDRLAPETACTECKDCAANVLHGARRYIWDEIPYYFCQKPRPGGIVRGFDAYMWVILAFVNVYRQNVTSILPRRHCV